MQHDTALAGLLQHDKVVHIPVQNSRCSHFAKLIQLAANWARPKIQLRGNFNNVFERCTLHRDWKATAQGWQINLMTKRPGYHTDASKSALSGFCLSYERHRSDA